MVDGKMDISIASAGKIPEVNLADVDIRKQHNRSMRPTPVASHEGSKSVEISLNELAVAKRVGVRYEPNINQTRPGPQQQQASLPPLFRAQMPPLMYCGSGGPSGSFGSPPPPSDGPPPSGPKNDVTRIQSRRKATSLRVPEGQDAAELSGKKTKRNRSSSIQELCPN
ncbi:hypothetical protein pipiens_005434 [Culex pipiens pipiens]|uniref:Uncharacterized protein n=1 Tax=Culex pipiens pipiens TaxID=38569 RepID=A0ABD1DYK6_CULPP